MTDEGTQELNDAFDSLGGSGALNTFFAGAETTDELGSSTVEIHTTDGVELVFDSILMCEAAGTTVVICKEAIQADGESHLVPTHVIPWRDVKSIAIPMDDGRLEAANAERIGVNK